MLRALPPPPTMRVTWLALVRTAALVPFAVDDRELAAPLARGANPLMTGHSALSRFSIVKEAPATSGIQTSADLKLAAHPIRVRRRLSWQEMADVARTDREVQECCHF